MSEIDSATLCVSFLELILNRIHFLPIILHGSTCCEAILHVLATFWRGEVWCKVYRPLLKWYPAACHAARSSSIKSNNKLLPPNDSEHDESPVCCSDSRSKASSKLTSSAKTRQETRPFQAEPTAFAHKRLQEATETI